MWITLNKNVKNCILILQMEKNWLIVYKFLYLWVYLFHKIKNSWLNYYGFAYIIIGFLDKLYVITLECREWNFIELNESVYVLSIMLNTILS